MPIGSRAPFSSRELSASCEPRSGSAPVGGRTRRGELLERARARVGTVLCRKWRLDAVLGVGGTATVFAGTHRRIGVRAAVKLLHPELAADATRRAALLREAVLTNRVGHPGVVRVLDDDVADDDSPFLVTQLLHGDTLRARWVRSERTLASAEVVPILEALLDVVSSVHAEGIVHRDIKPSNVFVARDVRIHLLDFGSAFEPAIGSEHPRVGAVLGTPSYMPPEQAAGRTWEVDARSDVWSVGAVAFALLSGQLVHRGESPLHTITLAFTRQARPMVTVAPHVPSEVAAIVDRALAFDRDDRWPDAESMRHALRQTGARARSDVALAFACTVHGDANWEDAVADEPRSGVRPWVGPWGGRDSGLPSWRSAASSDGYIYA
jgi:eukaryotic-like serine/threonine-protein kinase